MPGVPTESLVWWIVYAWGVLWSVAMAALALLWLRDRKPSSKGRRRRYRRFYS